ncbi:Casein kinase 1-like protein 1 [Gracilariopsis chorda]|uniref:Casein kinase 1-like protein 1 n=1 Tax=Gracilariopsis chorda TaxID=448386 RepID=A0A2V3IE62_9FLOR|nr:Casein kinase 1-like protein 1 [Gracilariopsis chorda]|eukprot:PXF40375.1 Casein kinase 1-like protein 1 [Gracilariopsis chorda]
MTPDFDDFSGKCFNRYVLREKLGKGSFGTVYSATNLDNGRLFAAKLEVKRKHTVPSLWKELQIYRRLHKRSRIPAIPRIYHYEEQDNVCVMIMDKAGGHIDRDEAGRPRTLPIESVLKIAYHGLMTLKKVHKKGLIHADLKPNNILQNPFGNSPCMYIVDFGLAKSFYEPGTKKHIEMKSDPRVVGPITYATVNTHDYLTPSRRDDLETFGYVLVQLFKGKLPWEKVLNDELRECMQKFKTTPYSEWYTSYWDAMSRAYPKVGELKRNISAEDLCEGMPEIFTKYMKYVRSMAFSEKPCYDYFCGEFLATAEQLGYDINADRRGLRRIR